MILLGIPDDVDPDTVRPTSEWRLSARTQRELAYREDLVSKAHDELAVLSDQELRVKMAAVLDDEILALGPGEDLPGFPDAATMPRDEMLELLASCAAAGFDPDIEVVYPGADDPTV